MASSRLAILSLVSALAAPVLLGSGFVISRQSSNIVIPSGNRVLDTFELLTVCAILTAIGAGIVALRNRQGGRRLAIAGLVLGSVWFILPVGFFILLMTSRGFSHGRPLRLRGRKLVAAVEEGEGWPAQLAPTELQLGAVDRAALAAHWQRDAQAEHASIAAFSKLSMQLFAVGAPPDLLRRTHEAALDEIGHAERCFALASRYAGRPLSAGPLPALNSAVGEKGDLASLAIESLKDGCIGEGASAAVARSAALRSRDPAVRETLQIICAEEGRHAELGWRIVEFCLERSPELAIVLERSLREPPSPGSIDVMPRGVSREILEGHGWVGNDERSGLLHRTHEEVKARLQTVLSRQPGGTVARAAKEAAA